MNKNISLKVYKWNIFKKITRLIEKFLNRTNKTCITNEEKTTSNSSVTTEKTESNTKESFINNIKTKKEEKTEIEKLQELLESNKITVKEISNKQIYELNILYQKQIEELKKNIVLEKKKLQQLNN